MKKVLILLQVLLLIFVLMPANANAQSKPDIDLEKLMEKLKKEIDEKLDDIKNKFKEELKKLLEKYLEDGEKPTPKEEKKVDFWLGISALTAEDKSGVVVTEVKEGSPADKAGIKVGDKITSFGKYVIKDLEGFKKILPNFKAGMRVGIGLKRGDQIIIATMTLAKKDSKDEPKEEPKPVGKPYLGVNLLETNRGVLIQSVVQNSPAAKAGILAGDKIFSIDGKEVKKLVELHKALATYKPGDIVTIVVVRNYKKTELKVTLGKAPEVKKPEVKPEKKVEPKKPLGKPFIGFSANEKEDGVYISRVMAKSPAFKAGFIVGDKLYYFGEVKIKALTDVSKALARYHVGQEVGCVVYRGEERVILEISLITKEQWEKDLKTAKQTKPNENGIWLGFSAIEPEDKSGIIISKVVENGPADRIGLMPNDKIISINKKTVANNEVLRDVIANLELGAKVEIDYIRGKITNKVFITIMTKSQAEKLDPIDRKRAWIGISLNTTYQGNGIQISVDEEGPAVQVGLKKDDILISINGVTIKDRMHFAEIWKNVQPGNMIKLVVLRGEKQLEFEMPVFLQPNHEDIPMPERPKVPKGWNLPQLPGGMKPEQQYAISRLSRLAIEAMQTADYDEAIKHLEKVLEIDSNNFNAFYNLACIYSLQNNKEKGLEYLKKAIGTGFIDWEHIKTDTDLDNLREMPAYKEMMANKKDLLKMVAEMKVAEIKAAYGDKFSFYVDIDNMLIITTEHPKEILEDVKNKLVKYAEAQWKLLFDHKPDYFITIIIPTPQTFNKIVSNPMVGGFYSHSTRSLIAKELGQTLIHEFTHALHYGDIQKNNFARQNIWFVEGIATCFENSVMKDEVPTPLHNGRLAHLQFLLKTKKKLPTLADFMARDRNAFLGDAGVSYTLSRYIAYWLWEQKLLKKYYDLYTEMLKEDPNGVKALEKLFEKPIDEIEKDWYKWVKELPDYRSFTFDNRPYIGIRPAEQGGGITILKVMENTPAFKAGFKDGDIISHIDGERILSLNDLQNLLLSHQPGDEIEITFVREGEKKSLKLKLVTFPKEDIPQTQPKRDE